MDLLILAVVAGLLVYRLNAVLGQKDKDDPAEKNPVKNIGPPVTSDRSRDRDDDNPPENVIALPGRIGQPNRAETAQNAPYDGPMSLDNQIAMLSKADASFDEMQFLAGAKAAFSMIVDAFARGDKGTLRPLLSEPLYHDFAAEIDERISQGHRLETVIQSIEDVAITNAQINNNNMNVTVRIVSIQTNMVRDDAGVIVSGGEQSDDVTDFWVFQRQIGHRDPNWVLVTTDAG